ncbi:BspA family leucine-rich repeat surface protein [Campylobacter sp. US33a]|nr:BspA family leucine-rich repeat surface protein [Campylobacter sp. US33a]
MERYTPQTKEELKALVKDESINLGDIDTSNITDMSGLFLDSTRKDFSGIESWDVSKVENMSGMFENCPIDNFNNPLFLKKIFNNDMTLEKVEKILSKLPSKLVFQALFKQELEFKKKENINIEDNILKDCVKELYSEYLHSFSDQQMLNEFWFERAEEILNEKLSNISDSSLAELNVNKKYKL